jgi:16S rRNA (guanine1207-N2)-methyltransferase
MSGHYYESNPTVAHNRHVHDAVLRGEKMTFVTDSGVFGKKGVDFGSRLLIESIADDVGGRLLDVGCGYGPIGLSLAKAFPSTSVWMIDINERAVALSQENARRNQIDNVHVMQSDVFSAVGIDERFTTIVTNPPIRAGKAIVHSIFEEARKRISPGGSLWIVIQKKQGAPSALEKLEQLFDSAEEVDKDKGFRIYRARVSL